MDRIVNLLASLLVILVAPAAAQITVAPIASEDPIPWDGEAAMSVNVQISCAELVTNPGTEIMVTAAGEFVTADEKTIAIGPADCATGSGTVSHTVGLTLTPSDDAPGVISMPINVTATMAGATSQLVGNATALVSVSYRPGHTLETDVDWPLLIDGGEGHFNLTITWTANAPTMVMFDSTTFTKGGGDVQGVPAQLTRAPPTAVTLPIRYQAPSPGWGDATFEFRNFSHYRLNETGQVGDLELIDTYTWSFVEGEAPPVLTVDAPVEDSPGVAILAVVALGLVAWRRR